jgi:hypothetical protein
MSESVFLPISINDDGDLKVTVEKSIISNATTYEKVPASKFEEKSNVEETGQEVFYDKDGNELKTNPNDGEEIFRLRRISNRANINDIIEKFVANKFFVRKTTRPDGYSSDYYGGRKRKQSKYSSKKRSVKSHRLRNSRKSRYSRRR